MSVVKEISDLIKFLLADRENTHKELTIGVLSKRHARILYDDIGVNLWKIPKIVDTSAVRHTMRKHSRAKREESRNQIAVTWDDFKHIPTVLTAPDLIEYAGKNSLKQDVFLFKKVIKNTYVVGMSVRHSKLGSKFIFSTLYIIKKPV